ncbi:hypothetical protein FYJ53_14460 [Eubacterium sp. BL-380-WT-2B]|uniref:S-layer homology domain-containing protein n=1 Tax=Eubacterium sp. BL-380-WT-2B TaxID=2605785 RepID=UPI0012B2B84F|nr:S-layer homology domain-containing protein [Eubacterium sp. BL-380-WT-2B]MSS94953.1 hypothetical protein [Eubacterium sp. BL-380-WT-2B]
MKIRNKAKHILSAALSAVMLLGSMPTLTFAAQVNEYVDPADIWVSANGRTNELDFNATITQETGWCPVCNKDTIMLTYRTPEYTKSGTTALNRGVKYSDGTMVDGETVGNLDNGRPNQDATYSTYHWTKSVCQTCGTINSIDGEGSYSFSRNVYGLNSCDHNFFLDFDNTTYEPYNSTKHTTTLKRGKYCQFCKGTQARATESLENHHFTETIDGQLGNNRFYVSEHCDDCGYETSEYITAKSVVSSYYGTADESAHTVTVSDLSDSGVHTSIRYGTSAGKCNLTSAPNYTEAGYYPVYYEIDYKYDGKNMTENGVSYVWLLEKEGDTIIVIPPTNTEEKHTHDFRYLEAVKSSCDNLGYERWQCDGCGSLEKRNYTPAIGHDYENITIREATCKQGGLSLSLCKNCGDFHQTTTPTGEHRYRAEKHNPTCRMTGYTEYTCEVCGDSYMNNITPLISHSFERITKKPTCTDKGYTTSTCTMCGLNYVSDYTEPTGHNWDEGHAVTSSTCTAEGVIEYHCQNENCKEKMIKSESATGHTPGTAATCTEPQTCEKCGTVLELPKGHSYSEAVIAPTCTAMGYSVFECTECGDSYTGNFTDKAEHDYNAVVTAPNCTQHGFTTYSCKNCDDEYISDYTDKIPHDYRAEITSPTCTGFGHTTYTCSVCGESYTADYTDKLPHNYNKQVIPPTCTEHGYTVYTCPDCGNEYIGDLTECEQHKYTETVIAPTCTEMGYTIFTCETCGDTYKSEYTEAAGHKPSDWIIDVPATIENAGSKHIECERCGEVLQTVELAQLIDKDNSDEDGNAKVGKYAIVLTDKDGKPIFNSEITIDKDDNITIKLPDGRLLDYADRTTITVINTENQTAAKDLNIFIADTNGNNATGVTDANGQFIAPASSSSTGDDNGTIGKDENDGKFTYVVRVTDKANVTVPNCETYIGESNNVVVKLPDGLILTQDSPAIIHITDQNGEPQKGVTVIVIADKDYIEKGVTDMYGKLTVPPVNSGYTDKDGKVSVQGYYVFVNDENKNIESALVTLNEDNSFTVLLPAESLIDYANRITVTILDKDGGTVKDMNVTVKDVAENEKSGVTDESGKMTVPPLSEDYTDSEGKAKVNGMNILVADEAQPIENAFIKIAEDSKINVILPESNKIDIANRISVTVTDNEGKPVKGLTVLVSETAAEGAESEAKTAEDITDANGKITVPPTNIDYTDINGTAQVIEGENSYNIVVEDTKVKIENAYVEIKDGKISFLLPDEHTLTTDNQTTVTVTDKDSKPVSGISVTIKDKTTEKTAATNSSGKVTLPVKTSGGGGGGSSRPSGGGSGGGGGYVKPSYTVKVVDKDGKTVNVNKTVKDDKITLTLPNGKTLDDNYYTITVTDNKGKTTADIDVTLKDKNNAANGSTNKDGVIILPASKHKSYIVGYTDGTFQPDGDMTRAEAAAIFARLISEEKTENISGTKNNFTDVKSNEWYAGYISYLEKYGIIKGYADNTFRPDEAVTRAEFVSMTVRYYGLFDKVSYPANTTKYSDINGKHWAIKDISFAKNIGWLNGYADGTFRPDNNITRAEVVTVVNHATGRYADKDYINKNLSVLNKFTDLKNNSHWGYYSIMEAANTHKAVSNSDTETWVK